MSGAGQVAAEEHVVGGHVEELVVVETAGERSANVRVGLDSVTELVGTAGGEEPRATVGSTRPSFDDALRNAKQRPDP